MASLEHSWSNCQAVRRSLLGQTRAHARSNRTVPHRTHGTPPRQRQLATVLFTDIVESTRMAEQLGDRRWRAALDLHGSLARDCVEGRGGNLVRSTGDGVLATFEGPGRAIRSAAELREGLGRADLDIRTGIHTGEVEMRGGGIDGIAVHLAARIMAGAAAGGVLVSRTVRDLVVGSRIVFEDRGAHSMKGIEGDWQLYSVVDA